jgi:hypothetical protein
MQLVQDLFLDAVSIAFSFSYLHHGLAIRTVRRRERGGVVTSMEEQRAVAPALNTTRPIARDQVPEVRILSYEVDVSRENCSFVLQLACSRRRNDELQGHFRPPVAAYSLWLGAELAPDT